MISAVEFKTESDYRRINAIALYDGHLGGKLSKIIKKSFGDRRRIQYHPNKIQGNRFKLLM